MTQNPAHGAHNAKVMNRFELTKRAVAHHEPARTAFVERDDHGAE